MRVSIHDEGAVAPDGTIIRNARDYDAFLERMKQKRAEDSRGASSPTVTPEPIQHAAPSVQPTETDDASATDRPLTGRALFMYRANHDGQDPKPAARDEHGRPLHGRALYMCRMKNGGGGQ